MALRDVLVAAEQIGLTEVVLPFILVFTVVFAVLQRSRVLGVDEKGRPRANYNAMVAMVLAFFALVMIRTVTVITLFTQYVTILLVAFVFLGIVFALLGVQEHHKGSLMFIALILLAFVLIEVLAYAGVLDAEAVNRIMLPLLAFIALGGGAWLLLRPKPEAEKHKHKGDEIPGLEKEKVIKQKGEP